MNLTACRYSRLSKWREWQIGRALFVVLALFTVARFASGLIITPVWDSTITNDPNAATIEGTINMAIQFYEARFTNPITVSIEFKEITSGLGDSDWWYYNISYGAFITNLQSAANTTDNTYALAHLPAGQTNPVGGNTTINVHTANLKALGFTGFVSYLPGGVDGIVSLNTSIMNLTRTSINPSKYDLLSVAEHEMDEVLALGSYLGSGVGIDAPFPQDLFRYTSNGARTLTIIGDNAYFSLDGSNLLVQFNQQAGDDYGDWWSIGGHTPRVQDAIATPAVTPNMGVELIALNVQGYNLVPPPQPGIVSIALSGTNLVLTGTNGLATGIYCLLTSTNMALPLSNWVAVSTNILTANGKFTFTATNAVNLHSAQQFYILQLQ